MMRYIPVLLLLFSPAWGQSVSLLTLPDNTCTPGAANCLASPHIDCSGALGTNAECQGTIPLSTSSNFGGAPVTGLSGITTAAFSTNTINISRASRLYIRVEGEAGTNSATVRVVGADANATVSRVVLGESTIDTAYLADATNTASIGTGLSCTTACYYAAAYWVPTLGLSAARIQVTAVSGTVSIYASTVLGQ